MINGYRDLLVWQKSMELATECYRVTVGFPSAEVYGLTLQLRKAAVSVPSNIAEGQARQSTRDFIRFLDIAYGSLAEVETQLLLSLRLGYCDPQRIDALLARSDEVGRMLNGLRRSLRKRIRTAPRRPLTTDP